MPTTAPIETQQKPEIEEQPIAKKMKMDQTVKCVLRFAKLTENAFPPVRGSVRAAGLDLRSAYDVVVPARGKVLAFTDLQVQVPEGSYGRVAPRSGLAVKNFIDVGAGVVDEDYRGNLGVVLFNHSDTDFEVKRGDRIAQFICERIFYPELEEVKALEETERGAGGFGSTGVSEIKAKNGNTNVQPETVVDAVVTKETKNGDKEKDEEEKKDVEKGDEEMKNADKTTTETTATSVAAN